MKNYVWRSKMVGNKSLKRANKEKFDEFYTQLSDIENELAHYKEHFKNKIVFCNCDDPYESNFFKYFALNFNFLGLKKLIATCYDTSPIVYTQLAMFEDKVKNFPNKNRRAYKIEISEVNDQNNDGAIDLTDVKLLLQNNKNALTLLNEDGDFRSKECVDLLQRCDIVVTNPPFSLFREYVAQLIEFDKKFLIIGNQNAISYKEIFALLKNNLIWLGNNAGAQTFQVPMSLERNNTYIKDGKKYAKFGNICWFTNLDITKRHEQLPLYKTYTPDEYPKYDNYNAINVDKVSDIPCDYYNFIGVPITFLDKYNPLQFEIVALGIVGSINFTCHKKMEILKNGQPTGKYTINAKGTLYKRYNPSIDKKPPAFKNLLTGELYSSIYARVIIRRKQNGN